MRIDDKPREECAVFGVSTRTGGAAALTMNGLLTLQHRGQEGAGIAVAQDGGILAAYFRVSAPVGAAEHLTPLEPSVCGTHKSFLQKRRPIEV